MQIKRDGKGGLDECKVDLDVKNSPLQKVVRFIQLSLVLPCRFVQHPHASPQKHFYWLEYIAYPKQKKKEQQENKQTQKWGKWSVNGIDVLCREKALKNLRSSYQIRTYARA